MFQENDVIDDRYRIISTLGTGGMGTVFKAQQLDVSRIVAIKVMHESELHDEESQKRFFRECKLLSKLSHFNIMNIYGITLSSDGAPLAICEYLDGVTLRAELQKGPLEWRRSVRIAVQVCDAMNYAHNEGILHRDLKPENLMLLSLPEPDHVKVMDFGLSRLLDVSNSQKLTRTGLLIGSPHYMSPEQSLGKADNRSDIYALACIVFEMLTGEKLFDADTAIGVMYLQANASAADRLKLVKNCPVSLIGCLQKALEKDALKRYQSMDEFGTALQASMVDKPLPRQSSHSSVYRRIILGSLFCLVIVGFVVLLNKTSSQNVKVTSHQGPIIPVKGMTAKSLCLVAARAAAAGDTLQAINRYREAIYKSQKEPLSGVKTYELHMKCAALYAKQKMHQNATQEVLLALRDNESIPEGIDFVIDGLKFEPDESDVYILQNAALRRLDNKDSMERCGEFLPFSGNFADLSRSLFASKRFVDVLKLSTSELFTLLNADDQWVLRLLANYSLAFLGKDSSGKALNKTTECLYRINSKPGGEFGEFFVVRHYLDGIYCIDMLVEMNEFELAKKQYNLLQTKLADAERTHLLSEHYISVIRTEMDAHEPDEKAVGKRRKHTALFMERK